MWVKLLLLFFVFSFLFKPDLSFDQDLGRHLKLGEIITQTWIIPKINLFSYTNPNFPFTNTHWLFEVVVYLVSQVAGLQTLLIIKITLFLLSVWLIFKTIPKENSSFLLPIGFIFLHVSRERTELRPEIFSFLFTAFTYYALEKYLRASSSLRASEVSVAISQNNGSASSSPVASPRNDISKKLIFLPLIQLIWINTHIYFFVGLLLQAIFLIYLTYLKLRSHIVSGKLKMLTIIFAISIGVSFINPNGLQGFLYPLNVAKNYGYTIVENQSMTILESINFQNPNFIFVKISAVIIVLSLLVSFFRRTFQIKNILLATAGAGLALLNVRSFPYLVFLSLPAVLQNFGSVKSGFFTKTLAFIFGGLLILESFSYLNQPRVGLKFVESAKGALDFVLDKNLPQPIFNNFDIGSYIIYRAYPKYKVFVDGRPEAYPKEFFQNIYIPMQSDYAKFKELEKEFGFKTIIFSHTDQTPWGRNFLQNVIKDSDWKTVYLDNFMIIFVKAGLVAE